MFVLAYDKTPLCVVTPGHAATLIKQNRGKIFKKFPSVFILNKGMTLPKKEYVLKIDPGAKTSGFSLVEQFENDVHVCFVMHLQHRFDIEMKMKERSMYRRSRRGRKTRYRKARWANRKKPKGWAGPSVMSVLMQFKTWIDRFKKYANIKDIFIEENKFDSQKMNNPKIKKSEYQNGPLKDINTRVKLMAENPQCFYCEKKCSKYEIDHFIANSCGGTNKFDNMVLACHSCNQQKNNMTADDFIRKKYSGKELSYYIKKMNNKIEIIKNEKSVAKANKINKMLQNLLFSNNISFKLFSAINTANNRKNLFPNYEKSIENNLHWIDSVCVGNYINSITLKTNYIFYAKGIGYGSRQMHQHDKFGFPKKQASRTRKKKCEGIMRGDIVIANSKTYKNMRGVVKGLDFVAKTCVVAGGEKLYQTDKNGQLKNKIKKFTIKNVSKIHEFDGYEYSFSDLKLSQPESTKDVVKNPLLITGKES